ncbi:MAG TPA: di-heme oxidoredictase family protein [Polyangiaceae bacterium]|jgi:YVTN family beta-propeller protein|nr:di-heme oxidoredictase family protein [Polyangiaceae bacterium]
MNQRFFGRLLLILALCAGLLADCQQESTPEATSAEPAISARHSSSLAVSADGRQLFVANPEADSISEIDTTERALVREILLAPTAPALDATLGAYTPSVMPRAVALSPDGHTLYVTGERSSSLYAIDVASGTLEKSVNVGSEPIGLILSADGASLFIACSQDSSVVRVDAASLTLTGAVTVPREPWALGWSGDGSTLLVTHLLGPGVTALDPNSMSVNATWTIPDSAARGDARLAHGQVRGIYDLASRPGTNELWIAHTLLGTDTAQPALNFESTAFPAISVLQSDGTYQRTLSTDAQDVPGVDGSFADVVSGPHALAFTSEGDYALVLDANSEDVMVLDATRRIESTLARPLPGKFPDGIVLSPDGNFTYVDERGSADIAVLKLDRSSGALTLTLDGAAIPRLTADPMPAPMRLGLELFNSANSSAYPITTDHWIACATCHMEGRSDAVTWLFTQGPRDTPSNAGGMLGTGFLFRTADRRKVQDYFHTINTEQGGRFDPTAEATLLDALSAYVNYALPLPIPPTTDPALVARGSELFDQSGCASCHAGPRFTDSGQGNPSLDLSGTITLHDVGTCVQSGAFPDVAHQDVLGNPRDACQFDTPSLNGAASTAPYLHDGSATTLSDAIAKMPGAPTSADALSALAEYVRSL